MIGHVPTEDDDLAITDPHQREAVHNAVFRSARASGLGPTKAHQVATHVARHLPGTLRTSGYRLVITWASPEARQAITYARRPYDDADR